MVLHAMMLLLKMNAYKMELQYNQRHVAFNNVFIPCILLVYSVVLHVGYFQYNSFPVQISSGVVLVHCSLHTTRDHTTADQGYLHVPREFSIKPF